MAKENQTKNQINEEYEGQVKSKTSKKDISKSMDDIKIAIELSDLIMINPEINNSLKEIDKVLLRNLSFISHLYLSLLM